MSEVLIHVGPQHPALKEPVHFKVYAEGEVIVRLELDLSYNHRGIEKAAEGRDFARTIPLLERICGICSHSHATTFTKGIEEAMGLVIPPRARWIRTAVAELERVHSHLLWLGVAGHEVGFNTLFMWSWRDREEVQDVLEAMTGNRVNYGINEVGGVRRDFGPELVASSLERIRPLADRVLRYAELVEGERTLAARFRGVGRMTREQALAWGAVGPTARASGVDHDIRKDDPYLAYGEIPWKVITREGGDVYARTEVRVLELIESLSMVRTCLEDLPPGPVRVKAPKTAPAAEVLSRLEAPRGELCHFLRTDGSDRVSRVDVRTPTMANWTSVAMSLPGAFLADIPIVVAAIDPCLSCTSRVALADPDGKGRGTLTWDELRARPRPCGAGGKEGP